MQHKIVFIGLTVLVSVFSLGFVLYNQNVHAGIPRITHFVEAGSWGAIAYPWPTISDGVEGETYSGHGHCITGISYDFIHSWERVYADGGYDEGELKVTVKRFGIGKLSYLYCSRTYPSTGTYAPASMLADIVESSAYSEGWIYMYPATYDVANWPSP